MKDIKIIHRFERAVVQLLNFDGWDLEWTGHSTAHCDAIGFTPKNISCCIEIKFRQKYYEKKLLEKYKYDRLMEMDQEVALYFVNDPVGNYMFWLNDIEMPELKDMFCPSTTMWNEEKVLKPCYLLNEHDAHIINKS